MNGDVDRYRFRRGLAELAAALAFDFLLHRHAGFFEGRDRLLDIVEHRHTVRIDQRREVIDVVAVDKHPGRVLADFVQFFYVFAGRQNPRQLVEFLDHLGH